MFNRKGYDYFSNAVGEIIQTIVPNITKTCLNFAAIRKKRLTFTNPFLEVGLSQFVRFKDI